MLDFQTWVHINLAAGALFLPITLEAAVRLRRRPGLGQAIVLGLVLAAAMLTDQESAVMCLILAGLALLPWLFCPQASQAARRSSRRATGRSADRAANQVLARDFERAWPARSRPRPSRTN